MIYKVYKRFLKFIAKYSPVCVLRIIALRQCGYRIGRKVYIAEDLIIIDDLDDKDNIFIKDHVTIAPRVTLITKSYPNASQIKQYVPGSEGPIILNKNAWIGSGVIIMPNITIGEAAVVGAGAVVTKDVAPYDIVIGVPARIMGRVSVGQRRGIEEGHCDPALRREKQSHE
jgi:maltose O-acetyltransferase